MRRRHVGDDPDRRAGDLAQQPDVSPPPRAQLGDQRLGVVRGVHQRQRNAELVVERPLRRRRPVGRRQRVGQQLLRRGLSGGAGDADDTIGELAARP